MKIEMGWRRVDSLGVKVNKLSTDVGNMRKRFDGKLNGLEAKLEGLEIAAMRS